MTRMCFMQDTGMDTLQRELADAQEHSEAAKAAEQAAAAAAATAKEEAIAYIDNLQNR